MIRPVVSSVRRANHPGNHRDVARRDLPVTVELDRGVQVEVEDSEQRTCSSWTSRWAVLSVKVPHYVASGDPH